MKNGTSVAIKCARHRVELEENARDLKFIAREIHAWSKCKHKNVLEILGLVEHRSRLATVSPWMSGGTLPEYVSRKPLVNRLNLCCHVAAGLAYLHQNDVVHGDLKGANALVSDKGVAKLADFGNTKLKEQSLRFTTRTSAVYSLRWAAPELLEQSPVSPEADVYALGMTIYETTTGQVPYADKTDMAVVMDIMIHKRLPDWNDDIINGANDKQLFRDLLNKCWSREGSARPRAADAEIQDEPISFEEFREFKINGAIRQIQFHSGTGGWPEPNDILLFEVETNDPIMGVHHSCIVVKTNPSILLSDGEPRSSIQVLPSHEISEIGHDPRIRQLVSTNKLVDITHLKRLLHLSSQYPTLHKIFLSLVIFECMKELKFEPAEMKNDDGFFPSLPILVRTQLEELKARFLTDLEVDSNNS
ncbi:hypothetical protein FRC09_000494 [Ceratobasidium sp. 395]|nr:hypothetical protein FRC09_000494 [Ceratobasidium sp. 395]